MGFFDSDIVKVFTNPGEVLAGGKDGGILSTAFDPLDLWGYRAKRGRNTLSDIQLNSAKEALDAQQEMLDQLDALYGPYREASMDQLPNYMATVTGGNADIPTSPMYELESKRGRQGINRMMASKGLYGSSARGASLADFLTQSGQNEAGRQYGRQLDMQRLGTDAINALGGAGRHAGANMGATYGNLGQMLNLGMQDYGRQRQASMNQGANALSGLSQYLMQRQYNTPNKKQEV